MTNVQFIIQYLSENPGARYTDITKALCSWKDKFWTRGTYCRYFINNPSNGYNCNTGTTYYAVTYPGHLWVKKNKTWRLTSKGRSRVWPGGMSLAFAANRAIIGMRG